MPTGQEHVQAALGLCQSAAGRARALSGGADHWPATAADRIEAVVGALEGVQDRFFLRSKLCLPFAARCEREATRLNGALAAVDAAAPDAMPPEVADALEALVATTRALDERSGAQGMTIT